MLLLTVLTVDRKGGNDSTHVGFEINRKDVLNLPRDCWVICWVSGTMKLMRVGNIEVQDISGRKKGDTNVGNDCWTTLKY